MGREGPRLYPAGPAPAGDPNPECPSRIALTPLLPKLTWVSAALTPSPSPSPSRPLASTLSASVVPVCSLLPTCVLVCRFLFLSVSPTSQLCLSLSLPNLCLSWISLCPHLSLPVSVPPETSWSYLSVSPSSASVSPSLRLGSASLPSPSPFSLTPTAKLRIHFSFCGGSPGTDHLLLHPLPSPQTQA